MSFYIESDPFLSLRPFPAHTDNLYVKHWHEIVFFSFFFHGLLKLAPWINRIVFGAWFDTEADKKTRENFNVRVVGIVQAILSVLICIPMFNHPQYKENPILGSYDFAGLASSFCIGYFIWDLLYCCLLHYDLYGLEFLFHAFGALFVFASTLLPFCQPYLCAFLIYEASTPFVQFHFMMTRSPKGMWPQSLITLNGLLLLLVFFCVRILWGVYATAYSFYRMWPVRAEISNYLIACVYVLNVGFQILNFNWFFKMMKFATRLIKPDTSKSKST